MAKKSRTLVEVLPGNPMIPLDLLGTLSDLHPDVLAALIRSGEISIKDARRILALKKDYSAKVGQYPWSGIAALMRQKRRYARYAPKKENL